MTPVQKIIVHTYRYTAITILGAMLIGAAAYLGAVVFYTLSSSWIAPLVISPTSEKILRLSAEIIKTQQTIETLEAKASALDKESRAIKAQEATIEHLIANTNRAVVQQKKADMELAQKIRALERVKRHDIENTRLVLNDIKVIEDSIQKDLQTGLMTRADATKLRASLNTYKTSATDATVAGVALERQLADLQRNTETLSGGPAQMPQAVDILAKVAGYRMQLDEANLKFGLNKLDAEKMRSEAKQLATIVNTLTDSPYYRVTTTTQPLFFAFVPYDNEDEAKAGQSLYSCLLQVIFCTEVGKVLRIYHDEEKAQHPFFRSDMRGVLAELELTDSQAAKSKVLFIGRPPFFF